MKNIKIGVCGLACSKCSKFKEKKCPGCQPSEHCPLPECAKNKDLDFCFDCKDFPCQLHYNDGPFNKEVLDFHKGE